MPSSREVNTGSISHSLSVSFTHPLFVSLSLYLSFSLPMQAIGCKWVFPYLCYINRFSSFSIYFFEVNEVKQDFVFYFLFLVPISLFKILVHFFYIFLYLPVKLLYCWFFVTKFWNLWSTCEFQIKLPLKLKQEYLHWSMRKEDYSMIY